LRKITAKSAVIFHLTTIIPQTGLKIDHFAETREVRFWCSPPVISFSLIRHGNW